MVNHNSAITFGSGFLTGLGGFVTFPVAVPTALGVALVLRLRLCLAIGVLGGYADLSPTCLAAVLLCVFGADPLPVLQQKSPELLRQQAGACKSVRAPSVCAFFIQIFYSKCSLLRHQRPRRASIFVAFLLPVRSASVLVANPLIAADPELLCVGHSNKLIRMEIGECD